MANRLVRPVQFAFEPDVVNQFSLISFGAAGAPTVQPLQSKGICNFAQNVVNFTGASSSSTGITGVSSFLGLYVGMTITGVNVAAASVINSMNPVAGTITLNNATTGVAAAFAASGGQYVMTFGSQSTPFKRLDSYVKLLDFNYSYDTTFAQGTASVGAATPATTFAFVVNNSVSLATLASVTIMTGNLSGAVFTAGVPASGELIRFGMTLCRSNAI